jgi:hypothetical protein
LRKTLEDLLGGSADSSAEDESPVLLVDNAGPYNGILTSEIAREVEELHGLTCYNVLKAAQLATLGYQFNVLPGVFASSSETTRKVFVSRQNTVRCEGCAVPDEDVQKVMARIAKDEIHRVADTSIVWMELDTQNID